MRETKYRAWVNRYGKYEMIFSDDGWMSFWDSIDDDIEPMQYIGSKDKNRREIYEGDILYRPEQRSTSRYGSLYCPERRIVVEYSESYIDGIDYWIGWNTVDDPSTMEIIGNTHENPELVQKI